MIVSEILRKKRDAKELSVEEISVLVQGIGAGTIPDYQASAFLMAAFINGLNEQETATLTLKMRDSGDVLNWRQLSPKLADARFADKHSTGGIGDKVSLILAPLAAACGLKVPMMSGRGLGHTGGTVDKLESIPGFSLYPSKEKMVKCLDEVGLCMMAQAPNLVPTDRKLYALRDVTATVENISLITASIVSKKAAEGAENIVFDVKTGSAAFMSKYDQASALAKSLVKTAKLVGLNAMARVTRMEETLGAYIGNALEVKESISILANIYDDENHRCICAPLRKLCIDLTADMLLISGVEKTHQEGFRKADQVLNSGKAFEVFNKMCFEQGFQGKEVNSSLEKAPIIETVCADKGGFIKESYSKKFGLAGLLIHMGRQAAEEKVDPAVGFKVLVKPGEKVEKGQPLYQMHLRSRDQKNQLLAYLQDVFLLQDNPVNFDNELSVELIK